MNYYIPLGSRFYCRNGHLLGMNSAEIYIGDSDWGAKLDTTIHISVGSLSCRCGAVDFFVCADEPESP